MRPSPAERRPQGCDNYDATLLPMWSRFESATSGGRATRLHRNLEVVSE